MSTAQSSFYFLSLAYFILLYFIFYFILFVSCNCLLIIKQEANASFTFTFASSKDGVVMSKAMGEVDEEKYFECLRVCKAASAKVLSFIRLATESKASKAAS